MALLILSTWVLVGYIGIIEANSLITGEKWHLEIKLELKDINFCIRDKTLILVTHGNDKYYVIEKTTPAPDYAKLYIIPDDQIKMITIESFKGRS